MPEPADSASQRQTSRGQVSRIDRGYFHRRSRFERARSWLIVACLGLGVAWVAWGAYDTRLHYSPGPVTTVHAKWENDCNACHVPFQPIKDKTWVSTAATRQAMDRKCEACHRGPAHHPLQVSTEVGSCASCHADHRGRGADITRVADRTCTACHADITAHRVVDAAVRPTSETMPITRFDDDHHPPFASLAADPGRLKFSHGRHMRAGLSFGPHTTGTAAAGPWTYGMLSPADRGRYQPPGAADGDLVQLSCASCHEFGSTGAPAALRTVSTALAAAPPGAYGLPVEFNRHCAACHALPFEGTTASGTAAALPAALPATLPRQDAGDASTPRAESPTAVLPHGLDASGMTRFLEARYLQDALFGDGSLLDTPAVRRPLPAARQGDEAAARVRALVEDKVQQALAFARGTCEKCHDIREATAADAAILPPALLPRTAARLPWFEVAPTNVPDIWLKKSRFDHGPHRSFDCRECHAAAYPDEAADGDAGQGAAAGLPVGSPLDNGTVMIAGRNSCTTCHAPGSHDPASGKPVGGARFDCVECHGYHGLGPHGSLGIGASTAGDARSAAGGVVHGLPE